jgi:hypothetical protein
MAAYKKSLDRKDPELSPETSARMFALFLRGTDCAEIARLNRGIALGIILRARLADDWDGRRREYRHSLLDATRERVQQITLESVEFVSNTLAAAHKQHGDKAKRYLQSGDESELGSFAITSIKAYRDTLDVLRELVVGRETPKQPERPRAEEAEEGQEPRVVPALGPAVQAPASTIIRATLVARGQR